MTHSPTATLVVAYAINLDNSTGTFVGYASLVDSEFVVLHEKATPRLLAGRPTRQLTLRLQIVDDTGNVEVVDGTVHFGDTDCPPAVALQTSPTAAPAWQFEPDTWRQRLVEDERHDPDDPPLPPPGPPFTPHGTRPPWCKIWPNCPGC